MERNVKSRRGGERVRGKGVTCCLQKKRRTGSKLPNSALTGVMGARGWFCSLLF